jgi:hypothetical protein
MSNLKIGFAGTFYTLWSVSTSENYATDETGRPYLSGFTTLFSYHQNLSTDLAKAQSKARARGCRNLTPDPELYGRNTSWESYKKSDEQKALDAKAQAESAKAQAESAKAQAESAALFEAFEKGFFEGRPFTFASNFSVAEDGIASAKIYFEPRDRYEEELAARYSYGLPLYFDFLSRGDLVEKYYKGYYYYTLQGFRSMKGVIAHVVDSKISKLS